jgi:uncharacterized protein YgiB involved in biofilm formation
MKSPKSLKLTLMMGAAATLTACGDTPPADGPKTFLSVQDCQQAGFPEERCREAYREAFDVHSRTSPKFASRDECERSVDVDQCVVTRVQNNDGSFSEVFVPLMAGYIVGNLMADRRRQEPQSSGGYGGGSYRSGPVYRSRDYPSGYRDSGDLVTSRQGGGKPSTGISSPSRPPNISTTTIARQGFGSKSFSFGGGSS